jgi:hypothetical protein
VAGWELWLPGSVRIAAASLFCQDQFPVAGASQQVVFATMVDHHLPAIRQQIGAAQDPYGLLLSILQTLSFFRFVFRHGFSITRFARPEHTAPTVSNPALITLLIINCNMI